MDGETIRAFFQQETRAMIEQYQNFELLIPSSKQKGSAHKGEDGRFIENLIKTYLRQYLPRELEVLSGFIVRPAVKTKKNNRSRQGNFDYHSSQLDIIVYNSAQYPIYLRSGDTVVVPPEGVICIISVKKCLHDRDIKNEIKSLTHASQLCYDDSLRGPFLALISMKSAINKKKLPNINWAYNQMKSTYQNIQNLRFDDLIGYVGVLTEWGIFKTRPIKNAPQRADYIGVGINQNQEYLGLQFLLTGILSVYYDRTRTTISRPGFTSFANNAIIFKDSILF